MFGALSAIGSIASLLSGLIKAICGWFLYHAGAVAQEDKDRGAEVSVLKAEQTAAQDAPRTQQGTVDELNQGKF